MYTNYLEIKKVRKVFGKNIIAVKDVSLTIREGELIVLVGPSGSGKTTLLRIIAGLEKETSGKIYFQGKEVNKLPPQDRNTSMVFQELALYPHLTAFENVCFPLLAHKVRDKSLIKNEVYGKAKMLEISHLLDRKIGELSGGQRQRVALARALVRKPFVFLMDEAFSNLDAALRRELRALFKRLQRKIGFTMVHVTHDQEEAMTMADRIVLMHEGELIQVATPIEIFDNPKNLFAARFFGSPPMNTLEGQIKRKKEAYIIEGRGFSLPLPLHLDRQWVEKKMDGNLEVSVGVRPRHFSWSESPSSEAHISVQIELLEHLGDEEIVHCRLENKEIIGVFRHGRKKLQEGKRVFLEFDPRDMCIFDGTDNYSERV